MILSETWHIQLADSHVRMLGMGRLEHLCGIRGDAHMFCQHARWRSSSFLTSTWMLLGEISTKMSSVSIQNGTLISRTLSVSDSASQATSNDLWALLLHSSPRQVPDPARCCVCRRACRAFQSADLTV